MTRFVRTLLHSLSLSVVLSLLAVGCGGTETAVCGPTNCNGCCSSDGLCQSGDTTAACGASGAACTACASTQICALRTCTNTSSGGGGGGGGGNGGTDGSNQNDGGTTTDGGATTGPIVAPAETWSFIDFPDAVCGNGAATGIGLNPTTRSTDIFIYMQGGGACWNDFTCFTISSASYIATGYTASNFASDAFKSSYAVNRSQTANPFKDMSFVYVPYCTGDTHAGDAVQTYGGKTVHHKGRRNIDAYLTRLAATFPSTTRVFVGGSSAGAFGAQINYQRVRAAFPSAQVHVLADCGQMINPASTLLADWTAAWNLEAPTGCTDCLSNFTRVPEYLATTYPNSRFGLLAYTQDNVLRQFFGYDGPTFETNTYALLTSKYDPQPNAKYYLLAGSTHVMLNNLNTLSSPGGKTLNSWVTEFVNGNPGWANVKP